MGDENKIGWCTGAITPITFHLCQESRNWSSRYYVKIDPFIWFCPVLDVIYLPYCGPLAELKWGCIRYLALDCYAFQHWTSAELEGLGSQNGENIFAGLFTSLYEITLILDSTEEDIGNLIPGNVKLLPRFPDPLSEEEEEVREDMQEYIRHLPPGSKIPELKFASVDRGINTDKQPGSRFFRTKLQNILRGNLERLKNQEFRKHMEDGESEWMLNSILRGLRG
ncbi:hypothetical protein F5884DRAFT_890722 [Xylogone sp. PMI_703]|nr:hypothetical protein F5884DRAFT_890722 [Xylogone sp. PMI_703]